MVVQFLKSIDFRIPYDAVHLAYHKALETEKKRAQAFIKERDSKRSDLEKILLREDPASVTGEVISFIADTLHRATNNNSQAANQLEHVLRQLGNLGDYQTKPATVGGKILALYDSILPAYTMKAGSFNVDLGFTVTAGVVSVDSLAIGKDPNGNPIPGKLYMSGYSLSELLDKTDFIGSVGIMLKGKPLTERQLSKFKEYMNSKAYLTQVDIDSISRTIENIKEKDSMGQAQDLMRMASRTVSRLAETRPSIDLRPLSMRGKSARIKAEKDSMFYEIADAGLDIGGRIMATAAYAVRELMKQKGGFKVSEEMSGSPDLNLSWGGNFIRYLYGEKFAADNKTEFRRMSDAMDDYFQIIRTHGAGNASTLATRIAGGAHSQLYDAIAAGIHVLAGERHGFANFMVYTQLEKIYKNLQKTGSQITDEEIMKEVKKAYRRDGLL